MGRGIPMGNPAEGRGWWRRFQRTHPLAGRLGAAPVSRTSFQFSFGVFRYVRATGKLAVRGLVVGLATPAAAGINPEPRELLTSGPEPANLIVMGLALAVLFLFRRFSKINWR